MKHRLSAYEVNLGVVSIKCDNNSGISFMKNPVFHYQTKHIEVRHYFTRDHVEKGDCVIDQPTNIFTKFSPKDFFSSYKSGIRNVKSIMHELVYVKCLFSFFFFFFPFFMWYTWSICLLCVIFHLFDYVKGWRYIILGGYTVYYLSMGV